MATVYCIDTSALIAAWYERYKPKRFPKLWNQLDALIGEGRLVSSLLVLNECEKRSPDLHEWLKEREAMFIAPDQTLQQRVQYVLNTYTGLVAAGKQKFAADSFVIATAEVHGYTLITEETGLDSLRKIPGVCNAMGIRFCNLMQLFDAEDWTIG
ncbi:MULTISPECIES: DUF4411 family protein [unclassified Mesorhizobium]|uniref:DUF4411 family protein n=1 Tax=unclassified Mesorhizobium TaxID=325217 RepID=UPI00333A0E6B